MQQSTGVSAQKLREQYKEEVEKAATLKFAELRPILLSNRERMEAVIGKARELRTAVEVEQKSELDKALDSLVEFVENKIAEAKVLEDLNSEELMKIEKDVSALSDAAAIESDPELAAARLKVLARLQEIGAQLQNKVSDSLRRQVAGMEDKGRMLQEQLISSMESDAYTVRKTAESSLSKIKEALQKAENTIQELQTCSL
jgi:flagellin-specific chaperone FliS